MIKRWKIANFKSIRDETELELAPLTIFAGANSSGKSTVLQSILLIAQTLQRKISSKSVVLNGTLCKFGQFRDLSSYRADQFQDLSFYHYRECDPISIGWLCEPTAKYDPTISGAKKINSVDCEVSFDNRSGEPLQPQLHEFKLNASILDHDSIDNNISICISSIPKSYNDYYIKQCYMDIIDSLCKYSSNSQREIDAVDRIRMIQYMNIEIDDISSSDVYKKLLPFGEIYAKFNHFLPMKLYVSKINDTKIAAAFVFVLHYSPLRTHTLNIYELLDIEFSSDLQQKVTLPITTLIMALKNIGHPSKTLLRRLNNMPEKVISLRSWADFVQRLHPKTKKHIDPTIGYLNKIHEIEFLDIIRALSIIRDDLRYPPEINSIDNEIEYRSESLSYAIEYIDTFFSEQVKYLGPLRSEPKSMYPIDTLVDSENVGLRGEQTAAVLYMNRKTVIEYLPAANFPPANSDSLEIDRTPVSKSLMDAVREWVEYLGVVKDIQVFDHGKLGHGIKVGQDGIITNDGSGNSELHKDFLDFLYEYEEARYEEFNPYEETMREMREELDNSQDLTHVGVGVSQVLPILVMGLLSKEDTTMIFEQPELHLHPLVQTRLADFFLSMALLKKQCIIETHSEHLINRLRFRAASAEEPLTDTSKIYFVEKKEGTSQFREVVINEYGSIEDWPSGFFDQSYTEAENILMASIKKRKKMRKRKDK